MVNLLGLLPLVAPAWAWGTWCGKHYELGAPNVPPSADSYFKYPSSSFNPLLDFRCTAASSIYLVGDQTDSPALIVDGNLTHDVGSPCKPLGSVDDHV
jgi:hypothetical protein